MNTIFRLLLALLLCAGSLPAPYDWDGSDDQLVVTNAAVTGLNGGSYSISAWVNADTVGEGSGGNIYYSLRDDGPDQRTWLRINTDNTLTLFRRRASTNLTYTTNETLSTGTWYHILVSTTTAPAVNIYINAVAATYSTSTNGTGSFLTGSGNHSLYIGSDSGGASTWDGRIAEVGVWNGTALSSTAATLLYNAGRRERVIRSVASNLGATASVYFPLNEFSEGATVTGSGAAKDRTETGATGTPANSPTGRGAFPL